MNDCGETTQSQAAVAAIGGENPTDCLVYLNTGDREVTLILAVTQLLDRLFGKRNEHAQIRSIAALEYLLDREKHCLSTFARVPIALSQADYAELKKAQWLAQQNAKTPGPPASVLRGPTLTEPEPSPLSTGTLGSIIAKKSGLFDP